MREHESEQFKTTPLPTLPQASQAAASALDATASIPLVVLLQGVIQPVVK
ncbi:MAG TPA: hypothetical protein VK668_02835 [Mucilaginibacter sp.]|nr:hypothetical protein [Mucilaginibacter sp.]